MVYTAVLGIAVAAFSRFFFGFTRAAGKAETEMKGSFGLRLLLAKAESDLYEANQLESVSASSVTFRCDIVRAPGYGLYSDLDGDGTANIKDTDDDGDAAARFSLSAADQWRAGYDLEDDDDDNDGNVDLRVSIYYSAAERKVYRSVSVNGGAPVVFELAAAVSSFTLTCYGAKREDLGRKIDLGGDGAAATGDEGEEDGVITEREIDWTTPPVGHGDRSGGLDTAGELKYVTSVAVYAEADTNSDGKPDSMLGAEIMPPLLALKRRR
ncbi:MAG: hypothetical protein A2X29_00575 [Elusimicrobia bacterium GWA2_64_40]|nr:MAG: hypothetical protein A2X29_00575 [Elusimicrobia bacterium GWA2_64_40]OGR66136.1 MAG: hypothetical protein A2X30_09875 [Elusimicrobia bacterium GWB2_63_16]